MNENTHQESNNHLSVTPIARANDPATSHQSAAITNKTNRAKQQQLVRDYVEKWPGRTSAEIASLAGADRYMVARRLPEIRPVHVINGEAKTCDVTGRKAMTWYRK